MLCSRSPDATVAAGARIGPFQYPSYPSNPLGFASAGPATIDADLSVALKKRNHLAHHFFVEHDHDILTDAGRRQCIDLLVDDLHFFKRVDTDFDPIWQGAWTRFGITQDVIDRMLEEMGIKRPTVDTV